MTRTISVTALLVAVGLVASTAARQAAPTNVRIMSGLNNPRGLALGPHGAIYVAEAGVGGAGPCRVNAQNLTRCFGLTGTISRFVNGIQERVVTGLPSHALPGGDEASGPHDVAFQSTGDMFVIMGLGSDPVDRRFFGNAGAAFGKLLQISADGQIREAGDVTAYERDVNPGGGPPDSNPYGLLVLPSVRLVADAGGNAVVSVIASGLVNTVAAFPSRPNRATDSVPTAIAVGPDGAYYVSELSGVPFAAGAANIYRIVPGLPGQVFRSGFTTVTDIDFGPDGSLYVIEHSTGPQFFALPGDLVRIRPDGTRTVLVANLNRPTSLVVDSSGSVYYTNRGITAGAGEVWKYTP
ncbi:MAG: ScyD/ScyE family protein [Vicinamibacterales bacterium]